MQNAQPRPALQILRGGLLASLLLVAACRSGRDTSEVDLLLHQRRYQEAWDLADSWYQEEPDDAAIELAHRRAAAAMFLDRGRDLTFADRDDEALAEFLAANQVLPGDPVVEGWVDKARRKLALNWLDEAQELEASDDFYGALNAYQTALFHVPDNERAMSGIEQVQRKIEYRLEKGDMYYRDGVNDLRSYALHEASSKFHYVFGKYLEDDPRATQRSGQTDRLLAEERLAVAATLDDEGLFNAARNEFRMALLHDPDIEEAHDAIARLDVEIQASNALDALEMLVLKKRYEEAEALLAEERGRSDRLEERFEAYEERIDLARNQELYDMARTHERDFLFEKAVAAYDALLERAGYFDDAITRRDTLLDFIADAARLYEAAEQAATPDAARRLLLQIQTFWPEYRDIEARLAN